MLVRILMPVTEESPAYELMTNNEEHKNICAKLVSFLISFIECASCDHPNTVFEYMKSNVIWLFDQINRCVPKFKEQIIIQFWNKSTAIKFEKLSSQISSLILSYFYNQQKDQNNLTLPLEIGGTYTLSNSPMYKVCLLLSFVNFCCQPE